MKLFGTTKKLINKTKNGEKVANLEVVEVVLVQCNLVDNQYLQKFEVLHTFTPNKCLKEYGFLSFARKYKKQLLDAGLDSLKTASKKVVPKAGEFIGNKISDAVIKSNDDKIEK